MTDICMYTIYQNPADYPGKFVVRKIHICRGAAKPDPEMLGATETLDEARKLVPKTHEVMMPRHDTDEKQIVEIWDTKENQDFLLMLFSQF